MNEEGMFGVRIGNWRRVILCGDYAIKVPASEDADMAAQARCLNRWEIEIWDLWRPRFGWTNLCPVAWGTPDGNVLIMPRTIQDVTETEIREIESRWFRNAPYPPPATESKPDDWGRLPSGEVVALDYGYAATTEAEIKEARREYEKKWAMYGPKGIKSPTPPPCP